MKRVLGRKKEKKRKKEEEGHKCNFEAGLRKKKMRKMKKIINIILKKNVLGRKRRRGRRP